MKIKSGIKLLQEIEGEGLPIQQGDKVIFNLRIFLNNGEEVQLIKLNPAKDLPPQHLKIDERSGLIDFVCRIGQREHIPGVEYSLIGMKVGGYRKVKVSPHLAYRETGILGIIPENAVLIIELWAKEKSKKIIPGTRN
mgnify:CR=1 FL=1